MSKYAALAVAVVGLCLAPNQAANSAPPKSDEVYAAKGFAFPVAL
jgi:hypothetical protein